MGERERERADFDENGLRRDPRNMRKPHSTSNAGQWWYYEGREGLTVVREGGGQAVIPWRKVLEYARIMGGLRDD